MGLDAGPGHGVHGDSGGQVLAARVLVVLSLVALLAGFSGGHLDLGHVIPGLMGAAVLLAKSTEQTLPISPDRKSLSTLAVASR